MRIGKFVSGDGSILVGSIENEQVHVFDLGSKGIARLSDLFEVADCAGTCKDLTAESKNVLPLSELRVVAPIDEQEVWAAGVTYKRSRSARMEESETAASCYDRVYVSPRPELFMKATPHRVSGPLEPLRIREDATWNVPEPELTLVVNSKKQICGVTIGNDMSSRDIEGDNPLYLPQAKLYDQSCGLGPWVTLMEAVPARERIGIAVTIIRANETVFEGSTNAGQLARTFEELVEWLGRDNSFPNGVFLMTGTGIVPDSDFTLAPNDIVRIAIDGIGVLENPIVQGA